jgi:hypothetical protein
MYSRNGAYSSGLGRPGELRRLIKAGIPAREIKGPESCLARARMKEKKRIGARRPHASILRPVEEGKKKDAGLLAGCCSMSFDPRHAHAGQPTTTPPRPCQDPNTHHTRKED